MLDPRNNAVSANPPDSSAHITSHGSNWYWAVFAVMVTSALVFSAMATRAPRESRIFHYITIAIVSTASISYFSMASDLGGTPVVIEFMRSNPKVAGLTRQIFYIRYIDWFITTPLLLFDILLTGGLPWTQILYTVFMDIVMVVTGLAGALVPSTYKWGYYVFGNIALLGIIWQVAHVGRESARLRGGPTHRLYLEISLWTIFLWTLYPIAWGLAEGGNVIASDSEAVFYGILDVLAKPVFGMWLLLGHHRLGSSGGLREKPAVNGAAMTGGRGRGRAHDDGDIDAARGTSQHVEDVNYNAPSARH